MDEWKDGYPLRIGKHDCRVETDEGFVYVQLHHWVCQVSGKHRWIDEYGEYVFDKVQYKDKRIA